MTENSHCVVVGYDGSPTARAAVELAVRHAGPAGRLVVVHAYDVPPDWVGWPRYQELLNVPLGHGRAVLDALPEDVPALKGVAYESELIAGRPATVLEGVAHVRGADEIVVGTRGFGPARALMGSVAHELLHTARRPVTVVPASAVAGDPQHEHAESRMAAGPAEPTVAP